MLLQNRHDRIVIGVPGVDQSAANPVLLSRFDLCSTNSLPGFPASCNHSNSPGTAIPTPDRQVNFFVVAFITNQLGGRYRCIYHPHDGGCGISPTAV